MADEKRYTISELAELTGVSRRTVRYYVQRTLIPPPLGAGRGHYYTRAHVRRIAKIRDLQDLGFSLDEIESQLTGPLPALLGRRTQADSSPTQEYAPPGAPPEPEDEEPSHWTRVVIAKGVELQVEGGTYRLSPARLKKLKKAVTEILGTGFRSADEETEGDE